MLGWFQALLPREDRFFDLFAEHSRYLSAGAASLRDLLSGRPEEIATHGRLVSERENDADRVTREVLIAVRRTFITPFDRGDIRTLITAMDDTIDEMQRTVKAIALFDVTAFDPEMKEMAQAIVECATLGGEAVPLLARISREASRISAVAEEISAIEGRADDLHDRGLKSLFGRHSMADEMPFIVGSTIYGHLESVVDRFDDVGNELNSIVIEHV